MNLRSIFFNDSRVSTHIHSISYFILGYKTIVGIIKHILVMVSQIVVLLRVIFTDQPQDLNRWWLNKNGTANFYYYNLLQAAFLLHTDLFQAKLT